MNKTNLSKRLDHYERQICLLLAGNQCEACGATEHLSWAHIVQRGRKSLRWDRNNSLILCNRAHDWAEDEEGVWPAQSCHYQFDHMMTDRQRYRFVNKLRPDVYKYLDVQIGIPFELSLKDMKVLLEHKKQELKELKAELGVK